MTSNQPADKGYQHFASAYFNALVTAITQASGSPWLVNAVPDAPTVAGETDPLQVKLTLDGSLQGEVLLELSRAVAAMLASKCLRQPVADLGTEQIQAIVNLIDAGATECCTALAQTYGAFKMKAAVASVTGSERTNLVEMTAADDDSNRITVRMSFDPALADALFVEADAKDVKVPDPLNLELVMDVELNVTLRFGQRQMTLREVLELTSGSVIELDRQVEEPIELLLEGKVIARGEAVVIDGNYGLRVTEVPKPITAPEVR